jgi:aminoglycoside 2''-phosphotransferase
MDIHSCRRVLESAFPDVSIRSCHAIVEGWDSFVLEVNGDLIFRFPRRQDVVVQQEREIRFLPELSSVLPVEAPRFEFVSRDDSRDPPVFVGYPKIRGLPLSREMLCDDGLRRSIARGLAEVLSALHGMPLDGPLIDVFPSSTADRLREDYINLYRYALREIFPLLTIRAREFESRWWTEFVADDTNLTYEAALVHADLGPEHILCDYDRRLVAGIIDWGDALIGDPAMDFAGLLHDPGVEFAEEVLSYYGRETGGNFMSRVRFYHRLGRTGA